MKTFGSVVFALALSLASSLCLAGERKLEIATTEYPPYYGKDLENGGFMMVDVQDIGIHDDANKQRYRMMGYPGSVVFSPLTLIALGGIDSAT